MKALKLLFFILIISIFLIRCTSDSLTGKKEKKITRIRVEGFISDGHTGQPIKDAVVEINKEKSTTNKEGKFIMPRVNLILPVIAPPIRISAEGYHSHYSILEVSERDVRYKYIQCKFKLVSQSAPAHLRASSGDTRIMLTWKPPNVGNPIGYNIYLENSIMPINAEPVRKLQYVDLGLTNGVEYIYFVRAVLDIKSDGSLIESPASEKVYAIPRSVKIIEKDKQNAKKKPS